MNELLPLVWLTQPTVILFGTLGLIKDTDTGWLVRCVKGGAAVMGTTVYFSQTPFGLHGASPEEDVTGLTDRSCHDLQFTKRFWAEEAS
jgi:hypothetical protein